MSSPARCGRPGPTTATSPFGVPRAERIRGEGDSGHLGAALHDCLPHDHQSPCRPLRRHRSSGEGRTAHRVRVARDCCPTFRPFLFTLPHPCPIT
ncbi:uncharacterized protein LOC135098267 isoform X3 [Scylla paramamosain]|uniref:uncharacterized protein LOC135098267 isoform X3 n=1 Tax=Scylla paramamosain TaxID=85552 RepID=UPI003083B7A6